MSNSGESSHIPAKHSFAETSLWQPIDPRVPLLNLSTVRVRMDSLQRFLSESINRKTLISKDQMDAVSDEIVSAIHQIIVNGASLLTCSHSRSPICQQSALPVDGNATESPDLKFPGTNDLKAADVDEDVKHEKDDNCQLHCEIVELDAVELLAEHIHFCQICGKGFKRDANLRMHMRAHGNQFKTLEALAKPERSTKSKHRTMFSCPFEGCNRNKAHKKFRPMKSVICVKNHFKRSHCPKMYSCNMCNRKSFSVVADLKSHLRRCGEAKWRCSCGTSFSRKDKLFRHMAFFEGHMPAVVDEEEKAEDVAMMEEDGMGEEGELAASSSDNMLLDGFFDGFGSIECYTWEDMLGMDGFCHF